MFIYQDGKLYVQQGEKFKGVNVGPLGLITPVGRATDLDIKKDAKRLSSAEVRAKFNGGYDFPVKNKAKKDKEEVVEVTESDE